MGTRRLLVVLCLTAGIASVASACGAPADDGTPGIETNASTSPLTAMDVAFHWAPVHYQDVNKKSGTGALGKSDFITKFDYDGDFNGRNNWDNLPSFSTPSHMYAAVSESDSHFFIYYMAYHPRDWCPGICEEHEHDSEGVVMLVRKSTSPELPFGNLEALVTSFHTVWNAYRGPSNSTLIGKGFDNPDSQIPPSIERDFPSGRVRTYQEPSGHGFIGCTSAANCVKADDGVRYVPSTTADVPPLPPNGVQETENYSLLDLKTLFARRFDRPTFWSPDVFNGDDSGSCGGGISTCATNGVNGIWNHSDNRTTFANGSLIGEDPAAFFAGWFSFAPPLTLPSGNYTSNVFLHQKCDVGRRMQGSSDPCVAQVCAEILSAARIPGTESASPKSPPFAASPAPTAAPTSARCNPGRSRRGVMERARSPSARPTRSVAKRNGTPLA